MTLIDHEPNGDSATVLVLALAKIHTRTVTKNDDGTFTIVTDDGTFTDTEVMDMLSSFGYRANHAKYTHALAVVARFPPTTPVALANANMTIMHRSSTPNALSQSFASFLPR